MPGVISGFMLLQRFGLDRKGRADLLRAAGSLDLQKLEGVLRTSGAEHFLVASIIPEYTGGDDQDDDEVPWSIEPYTSLERAGRLKKEADSIWHKMTHLPKDPFCTICNECKAQRRQCRRGQGFGGAKAA